MFRTGREAFESGSPGSFCRHALDDRDRYDAHSSGGLRGSLRARAAVSVTDTMAPLANTSPNRAMHLATATLVHDGVLFARRKMMTLG